MKTRSDRRPSSNGDAPVSAPGGRVGLLSIHTIGNCGGRAESDTEDGEMDCGAAAAADGHAVDCEPPAVPVAQETPT